MNSLLTLICISFILIMNLILTRRKFTYSNLFLAEWFIILFFSSLKLDEYYNIDDYTYTVICIGLCSFFMGSIVYRVNKNSNRKLVFKKNNRNYRETSRCDFSNKVIMLVLVIHLLTSIYFSAKTLSFLRRGYSYAYMRNIFQGYDSEAAYTSNQIEDILRTWIALPLQLVMPILSVSIFIQKNRHIKYFYTCVILDQILYVFYSQSKSAIIYIAFYMVILVLEFWKQVSKKTKKKVKRIVVASVILTIGIFTLRNTTSTTTSVSQVIYKYICGNVNLLDQKIKIATNNNIRTYGVNFIYGFLTPIESLLGVTKIGKTDLYMYVTEIQNSKEQFIRIGPARWMNAYCTTFYDFFLDFRIIGVICGCFVFGLLAEIGYRKLIIARESKNTYELSMALSFALIVFMSMIRWEFVSASFAMALVYFVLMKTASKYVH